MQNSDFAVFLLLQDRQIITNEATMNNMSGDGENLFLNDILIVFNVFNIKIENKLTIYNEMLFIKLTGKSFNYSESPNLIIT